MSAITDRILTSAKLQLPGAVDGALKHELFNVVEDVARNVLRITFNGDSTADPATWLTDAQYKKHYQLLLDGLLGRMFAQPSKPYFSAELAAFHFNRYQTAFAEARDIESSGTPSALSDRLMNSVRIALPAARDPVIIEELWNTINDLCRDGWVWRETISITLVAGQTTYTNFWPSGTDVVQVFSVSHATMDITGVVYEYGQLLISNTIPTANDALTPLFVSAALTPWVNVGEGDIEAWIPGDMWSTHYETILSGVKGRMMLQIGKPYFNRDMGAYWTRDYKSRKMEARHKVRLENSPTTQLWRFPSWSRARSA